MSNFAYQESGIDHRLAAHHPVSGEALIKVTIEKLQLPQLPSLRWAGGRPSPLRLEKKPRSCGADADDRRDVNPFRETRASPERERGGRHLNFQSFYGSFSLGPAKRGCKSLGKPLPTDAERLFPFRAKDDGQMCLKQGKKVVSNADTRSTRAPFFHRSR